MTEELRSVMENSASEWRGDMEDAPFDFADAMSPANSSVSEELTAYARRVLDGRRARSAFFYDGLFGEPAWDILLDLFVAEQESKQISISSACIAAGGSSTTALRWLSRLEEMKLVERRGDTTDRRRVFVRITPRAHTAIVAWLIRASGKKII